MCQLQTGEAGKHSWAQVQRLRWANGCKALGCGYEYWNPKTKFQWGFCFVFFRSVLFTSQLPFTVSWIVPSQWGQLLPYLVHGHTCLSLLRHPKNHIWILFSCLFSVVTEEWRVEGVVTINWDFILFCNRVSYCRPGWPGTHSNPPGITKSLCPTN